MTPIARARMNVAQAVTRSNDGSWLATDQHIETARKSLRIGGHDDLADRLTLARSVCLTTAEARAEMREVMQLIDAKEEFQQSMADTDASSSFRTREVSQ